MTISLADAHTLLTRARRAAPDRRRFRRVDMGLHGRLMNESGLEFDCRTLDVSPGDARLSCSSQPSPGERLVLYLQKLGRVEANVSRVLGDSLFAVQFGVGAHKRERLAEHLMLLMNPQCVIAEERRNLRHTSGGGITILELEDGSLLTCEIVDFSLTGVALRTGRPRPLIGSWVKIGGQHGRVTRFIDQGFAVDFDARRTRGND